MVFLFKILTFCTFYWGATQSELCVSTKVEIDSPLDFVAFGVHLLVADLFLDLNQKSNQQWRHLSISITLVGHNSPPNQGGASIFTALVVSATLFSQCNSHFMQNWYQIHQINSNICHNTNYNHKWRCQFIQPWWRTIDNLVCP